MTDQQNPLTLKPHLLRDDEHERAVELFARCFAEELWCAALVEILANPADQHAYLLGSCRTDLECFSTWNGVFVVSDEGNARNENGARDARDASSADNTDTTSNPVGLTLVGGKDMLKASAFDALSKRAFEAGCETLPPHSRKLLSARLKQMEDLSNGHWMERFCAEDFRYIYAICVDTAYRGTGVFGLLIDPIIAECDQLGIPLCLECYTERLVALYGSRGFEVVETVTNPTLNLTEHCMIRKPQP
jgi:GNAT superfamily N-acetyltransferase